MTTLQVKRRRLAGTDVLAQKVAENLKAGAEQFSAIADKPKE
jgi:hypothetical protein